MSLSAALKTGQYRLSFFLVGAYSIAAQIILIREFLVILYGNELSMGTIFAAWLMAIFAGALCGGRLAAKVQKPLPFYLFFLFIISALPFFQIGCIRNLRTILHILPGETIGFTATILAIGILLFPLAFMIGLLFPFAAAGYPRSADRPSHSIGLVYIWESVGSMAGGAALTYFFIGRFPHMHILAWGSALIIVVSCVLSVQVRTSRIMGCVTFSGLLMAFIWIGITCFHGWDILEQKTIQQRWNSINPYIPLIESVDSRYQNLVLGKLEDQYSIYGNGQHIVSFPDPRQSAASAHFLLTQHPDPQEVLLIGGGVEGLLAEILKHSVKTLHYVELDPALVSLAQERIAKQDKTAIHDPRVTFFACDGRYFVKNAPSRYDLIIINTPDPSTAMLNRYYTVDFYHETNTVLQPGGLVVTKVSSAVNYIAPEVAQYVGSVYHALARVFSHVLVLPGEYNYFFAGNDPFSATPDSAILKERFENRKIDTDFFTPLHFSMLLTPDRVDFINDAISSTTLPHLNTDDRPVSYFNNLIVWESFSRNGKGGFLNSLTAISATGYVLFAVVLLFGGSIYLCLSSSAKRYQRLRFGALTAIATTGFAGMGLEIVLLFAFQSHNGYLYHYLGIMVACFMAGLAIGATIMNRFTPHSVLQALTTLLMLEILVGAFSISLPWIIHYGSTVYGTTGTLTLGEWTGFLRAGPFLILILIAGILTGVEFPLVTHMLMQSGGMSGRVAGMVDGLDHGGAAFGAALTGTLLVPLYGVIFSTSFIAALNAVSVVFLVIILMQLRRES